MAVETTVETISPLRDIVLPLVVGIICTAITACLVWIFQTHVRIFLRRLYLIAFNKQFRFKLFFKFQFNVSALPITSTFLEDMRRKFPQFKFSKSVLRPDLVMIKPEQLGNKIIIQTSSIRELMADDELADDTHMDEFVFNQYELTIRLDDDLCLGYQNLDVFQNYLVLFDGIKDILKHQAFQNQNEINSFILCDIIRDIHPITKEKSIVRNLENAKISFVKDNVKIKLKNTVFLEKLIKEYIAY
jgi:hypothetical protein